MKQIKKYEAHQQSGILLNANESQSNLDVDMIEEICEAIKKVDFNRYPFDQAFALREAYSKYCKVDPSQIMAGNGSDELIGLLIHLFLSTNKVLYTMELDFSMYDYYTTLQDAKLLRYAYDLNETFDVDDFIKVGKANKVDLILFSNPNNPTGRIVSNQDIIKIVEAFSDSKVIIDEAYGEFNDESMIPYINQYNNLIVTRTLSKAFSLASIRCGFLMTNKQLFDQIDAYKVPYNINSLSQITGEIVLQHLPTMEARIAEVIRLRDEMYAVYQSLKVKHVVLYPSKANFFYGSTTKMERLKQLMQENNIVIRYFNETYFRITVGTSEQNVMILSILQEV